MDELGADATTGGAGEGSEKISNCRLAFVAAASGVRFGLVEEDNDGLAVVVAFVDDFDFDTLVS